MSEPTPVDAGARRRLEDRLRQARIDLDAVRDQLEIGELGPEDVAMLEAKYRAEEEALQGQLVEFDDPTEELTARPSGRRIVGALVLVGAFSAVAVLAAGAIRPRSGGFITGNDATSGGIDLDEVSNEQMEAVIAANPDNPEVATMRVALANRYFEEGDFSAALEHYLSGLDGQLAVDRRAQALGRVGWMTFLSGELATAELYIQEALATDAEYGEGQFFYGLLLTDGLDQPCDAVPYLEAVSGRSDVPEDVRTELDSALARAQAGCGDDA